MNPNADSSRRQIAELSPPGGKPAWFTYSTGDRPLDGYTIKRGIGSGGFGEVYYAVSDGGKEVALKQIQRHLDVELRGVSQCLNLKHPNLVVLFDVKQSERGENWVVMEYVAGETLGDLIARSPSGLPGELVVSVLRAISDAVGYLHDHGIVHRDLKPGNIFIENGVVKIGDYGLAKYISASRRSGQTESVGTVHYMAPEIARGRYGKEIDQYAVGVILFEMLTGRVPFVGESPGEILMKHLTAEPDTSVLPAPYRAIVSRLLAKDPEWRYASMSAMLHDVQSVLAGRAPAGPPSHAAAPRIPPPIPSGAAEFGAAPHAAPSAGGDGTKRLVRSVHDRIWAGVCSGVANYFEIDPFWIRAVYLAGTFFTGFVPGIVVYLLLCLVIPAAEASHGIGADDAPIRRLRRPRSGRAWAGVCNAWATYFEVDPVWVRLPYAIVTFFTGIMPGLVIYFLMAWIIPEGTMDHAASPFVAQPRGPGVFRRFFRVIPRLIVSLVVGAGVGLVTGAVWPAPWGAMEPVLFAVGAGFATASMCLIVLCRRLAGPHRVWPGLASLFVGAGVGFFVGGAAESSGTPWSNDEVAVLVTIGTGLLTAATAAFVLFTSLAVPLRWRWFFEVVFLGAGTALVAIAFGFVLHANDDIAIVLGIGAGLLTAGTLAYLLIFTRLAQRLDPAAAFGDAAARDLKQTQSYYEPKSGASRWMRNVVGANPAIGGLNVLLGLVAVVLLAAWAGLSRLTTTGADRRIVVTVAAPPVVEWEVHRLTGHNGRVSAVAFSPDGKHVATGGKDHTVRLWDLASDAEVNRFTGHTAPVTSISFSADGTRLAASAECRDVRVWDVTTGKEVCKSIDHPGPVYSVAISPDGTRLATGSDDDIVRLLDATTGKQERQFLGSKRDVRAVAFSPDGTRIAAGSREHPGVTRIWDVATGRPVQSFLGDSRLKTLAFSRDGRLLAACGEHSAMAIWDIATGKLVGPSGSTNWGGSLAFNPAGGQLVYAESYDAVALWDFDIRRVVCHFSTNRSTPTCLAFSADGSMIAAGRDDGAVRVWEVPEPARKTKPLPVKNATAPATDAATENAKTEEPKTANGNDDLK